MRWIFIGVWVIAVSSVSAFVWLTQTPHSNQHTYYTSLISEGNSVNMMTLYGKVVIAKETTVVPLTDGTVTSVIVKPGDFVTKGTVMASLDLQVEDFRQYEKIKLLTQDTGPIENLNRTIAEIGRLEKSGFYDAIEASKKRSEVYSSLSQLMSFRENLQKQFNDTHGKMLVAPFDGYVTDVRLKPGQRVSVKDHHFDISITVAPENYKIGVELEVSDELLFKFKEGQHMNVSIPLSLDQGFSGVVTTIPSQAYDDKKMRYFKVLGEITTKSKNNTNLASGMKVVVAVNTIQDDSLTWIPKAALDIHLDDKVVSSKFNYVHKISRSIASSKVNDFKTTDSTTVDSLKDQSSASKIASNTLFPNESRISEIYILTPDNRVVMGSIQIIQEAGEMIAVHGKELRGMRVITHYKPKASVW